MSCLDAGAVEGLLDGALDKAALAAAQRHALACPSCRHAVASKAAMPVATPDQLAKGTLVDRYLVVGPLASVGPGELYEAYDPQLERRVVLKLTREKQPGRAESEVLHEAKAMARLAHPNVQAVFDAGLSRAGAFFLALERIGGRSLDAWYAQSGPGWRRAVEVLASVGEGLAAAHAAGVIHGDLHPGNVWVGSDGRPRLTGLSLGAPSRSWRARSALYAAPELAHGSVADARSDQYSYALCALGSAELPVKVRQVFERGASLEPADRFPTMDALLRELAKVTGRRKARRLQLALAGLLGVGLAVLGQTLYARHQLCRGAVERLAGIWDGSTKERVKKAMLATGRAYAPDVWLGVERTLDEYATAWVHQQDEACAATRIQKTQTEEALDLRSHCLSARRQSLAALSAQLTRADGKSVERALQAAAALPTLSACADAAALKGSPPPADPALRARLEAERAELAELRVLTDLGKPAEVLPRARALAERAEALGHRPLVAEAQGFLGPALMTAGDIKGAEKVLREAQWAAEASRLDELSATAWAQLVFVLSQQGRRDEAQTLVEQARAALVRIGNPPGPAAFLADQEGLLASAQGKFDVALAAHQRALELRLKAYGPEHPRLALSLVNLGTVHHNRGEYADAIAQYRRALEVMAKKLGPKHPQIAVTMNNIAAAQAKSGKLAEAAAMHREVLALRTEVLGPDHLETAQSHSNLGHVLSLRGDPEEGLKHLGRSLEIREKAGVDGGQLWPTLNNMAEALRTLKRYPESIAAAQRALDLLEKARGPDHPYVAYPLEQLALSLPAAGEYAKALEVCERVVAVRQRHKGDVRELGTMQAQLAWVLFSLGKDRPRQLRLYAAAKESFSQCLPGCARDVDYLNEQAARASWKP